ncbi:hypothetical protein TWF730_002997 [Orbilia blumenaviensis]|uniref:Uncharacterized protein n=1 Tax=Orbilia blumenaviensis TaxID=1796055 RepID=A0AAV9U7J9_9PEZI
MGSIKLPMTLILALIFHTWLAASLPAPIQTGLNSHHGLDVFDEIQWTGPVVPGGDNYTFLGSVESIKRQIESTPGFDPVVFDVYKHTSTEPDLLLKRAGGSFNVECTRTSDKRKGADLLSYLIALKHIKDLHGSCSVIGRVCKRFGCKWEASVGICVFRETPFNIECAEIFRIGEILINTMIDDFTGKVPDKCQIVAGDKNSAVYYSGDANWSLDGRWWTISAWHSSCILQPWLSGPLPWPQSASDFEPDQRP